MAKSGYKLISRESVEWRERCVFPLLCQKGGHRKRVIGQGKERSEAETERWKKDRKQGKGKIVGTSRKGAEKMEKNLLSDRISM